MEMVPAVMLVPERMPGLPSRDPLQVHRAARPPVCAVDQEAYDVQ